MSSRMGVLATEDVRRSKWYAVLRSDPALVPLICSLLDTEEKLGRPFHPSETRLPHLICTRMAKKGFLIEDGAGLFRFGDPTAIAWAVAKHEYVRIRVKAWAVKRQ